MALNSTFNPIAPWNPVLPIANGDVVTWNDTLQTWTNSTGTPGSGDVTASGVLALNAVALGGGTSVIKTTTTGTGVVTLIAGNATGTGALVGSNSPTFVDDFDLGAAGVRFTGAAGVLTLLGLGAGADESLTIDLDGAGANTIAFGTGSGVTTTVWPFIQQLGGTAGVAMSAADGVLTILGLGNGADESLTIDLDNAGANTIAFGTGTGATTTVWPFIQQLGGTAGVALSAANGVLTLLGLGDGADESLLIDLNTTTNTIGLSSGSGATVVSFGALNASFASGSGLSFAGLFGPTTIVGGQDATATYSALIINNDADDYAVVRFPSYSDIFMEGGGSLTFSTPYASITNNDTDGVIAITKNLTLAGNVTDPIIGTYAYVVNTTDVFTMNQVLVMDQKVIQEGSGNVTSMYCSSAMALHSGAGTTTNAVGQYGIARNDHATGTITNAWGHYSHVDNLGAGTITSGSAYHALNPENSGGGTFTDYYALWSNNIRGNNITNGYFLWYDGGPGGDANGAGVWRVNDFGIMAYYNPAFTKYTPGLANFEREILRWGDTGVFGTDNIAYFGVEVGGTGTNRNLNILGAEVGIMTVPGTYGVLRAAYKSSDGSTGITNAAVVGATATFNIKDGIIVGVS